MNYSCTLPRRSGAIAFVLLLAAVPAAAQRRARPEFTQQSILVGNFGVVGPGRAPSVTKNDLKLGREVGDGLRDRLSGMVDKREGKVIQSYHLRDALLRSGFSPDTAFSVSDLRVQATHFRTDEIVTGTAVREPGGLRIEATLFLYRDLRLRQPIPAVSGANLDRALDQLAARVHAARAQLRYQRRCENALRDGDGGRAIQSAREGVAAYPRGTLARTCLMWALKATGAPIQQVLAEAEELLAVDAAAPHALEAAATSFDSLKRRANAADMWIRLYETDSTDLELAERVIWSMAQGGNSRRAEPIIIRLSEAHPGNLRLLRQKWRIANDNRSWPLAVTAGEKLLALDAEAATDSIFFLRLATAYRANGQAFKAMETVARGVSSFPADARLYSLYTQFVKEESDTVIARGLALHPNSAELLALNAKDLRSRGQVAEALAASRKAVELDSTIAQGRLLVAQAEMELGRPDSALVSLRRAVAAGEDKSTVAQFVVSKGNQLFRAANGTENRGDFQLAMRFLVAGGQPQIDPADQVPGWRRGSEGRANGSDGRAQDHGQGRELRVGAARAGHHSHRPREPRSRAGRLRRSHEAVPRVPRSNRTLRGQAGRRILHAGDQSVAESDAS